MSLLHALDFSEKTVLITGASDGIGYGIATAFVEAGATVHVTGTRSQDSYDKDFAGMTFHTLSLQDGDAIEALSKEIPHLDVLVNCVGTVLYKKAEFERESFTKVVDINLTGAMHLSTAFYDQLEASSGNIIHLDSVVSIRPAINNPAYSASKAGLVQLTKALASKWARKGVRVNTVAPGMVPTKITANQATPEALEHWKKVIPMGRVGSPEDIAGAVLFLASPMAAYVTGQHIAADGGGTI
ncbi:SDR family oxidoreductase [Maricurvus nonylphenolicus]|uniref:SDR family NAD(P)-dependent oxidoreductase n=1 Tax=Maricurvus nonylphenolicus TaxID=1008307 RepID=UPI0036F258C8